MALLVLKRIEIFTLKLDHSQIANVLGRSPEKATRRDPAKAGPTADHHIGPSGRSSPPARPDDQSDGNDSVGQAGGHIGQIGFHIERAVLSMCRLCTYVPMW